jgi:hypothetical protein
MRMPGIKNGEVSEVRGTKLASMYIESSWRRSNGSVKMQFADENIVALETSVVQANTDVA